MTPDPGSPQARRLGCTCRGERYDTSEGHGWFVNVECKVHRDWIDLGRAW